MYNIGTLTIMILLYMYTCRYTDYNDLVVHVYMYIGTLTIMILLYMYTCRYTDYNDLVVQYMYTCI